MTRLLFERLCRTVALVALLAAMVVSWRGAHPAAAAPAGRRAIWLPGPVADDAQNDRAMAAALDTLRHVVMRRARNAAAGASADTLLLPLKQLPWPMVRAALGALQRTGVPVHWTDSTGARGLAASLARAAVPGAPLELRVSANARSVLSVRDAGGLLDTLPAARDVQGWQFGNVSAPLVVAQRDTRLSLAVPDSQRVRRVMVQALPGWEGKFVVAALEEAGWAVDGRLQISPTGRVTVGEPQRLDTARYAAVVVVDSMAVDASLLLEFAKRGGGVVLGGDALRIPALAAWRPARPTSLRGGVAGGLLTDSPRSGLEAWELEPVRDAVLLAQDAGEHAHAEPALLARREGAGRVVAMPYRDTWRWRMQGTDEGLAEHRAWWHAAVSAAVSEAGAEPVPPEIEPFPGDAAPYADLVARLGEPVVIGTAQGVRAAAPAGDERVRAGDIPVTRPWVLLLVTLLALLAEWCSRRLRGAR